jgi:hypothetical protein
MGKSEDGGTPPTNTGNIENSTTDKVTKSGKKSTSAASGEYIPLATFEEPQQPSAPPSPSFVIDIPTGGNKKKNSSSFADNQPLMSYRGESNSSSSSRRAATNNHESGDSQVSVDMKYSKGSPINSASGGGIIGVAPAPARKGFWARWFGKRVPQARSFPVNETSQPGFPPNKIRNQKYHAYSFLFVVLFNQVRPCCLGDPLISL